MGRKVTLNLDADTEKKLAQLSGMLGYSQEMAAIYAIRLVSACVREGLLEDVSGAVCGEQASTGTGGRVLEMPKKKGVK